VTTRLEKNFAAQMIQGFLCYEVGDPSRRPVTSVPQSSLRPCAVFSKLVFSPSAVKLSGTRYLFRAVSVREWRVAQYQFMRSHPMQNVNTSNNNCIDSSLFVTTHHIQCHQLHRFMLITLHKIVTPFNLTWMIWEEMSGLVAKNAYIFVQKLNGT